MTKTYRVMLPNPKGEAKRIYTLMPCDGGARLTRVGREKYFTNADLYLTKEVICQDFQWIWDQGFVEEFEK